MAHLRRALLLDPCLLYLDTHVTRSRNSLGITALTRGGRCKRTAHLHSRTLDTLRETPVADAAIIHYRRAYWRQLGLAASSICVN